ncbi:D-glucose-1-phosphatase [Roseivivax sp. THAF40]|uniref:HAD family hydrolase n=1 Tax=unclassified Roseivivax TaxID=2639302 RepID=UPI001267C0F7|nr:MULTISPECIES: HAD family phosphatase [unclassified Roseivivax]QFS81434.1 D-glucose-1-phosphatase [Roseivivax sp. THAF197b]QFT45163.1 D-glucose-1-phosphatase [Roseivivax sp. THAF40]
MSVRAVVFDIGNVLIEWNPERFFDARIGRPDRERLFAEVDLHHYNDLIDRGHDFRATIYDAADAHPEWRDEIRLWHDCWAEIAGPDIPHSLRLLRALRAKGVPCYALSNFGIGTFEVGVAKWPFLREFDQSFISGHMGMAKPDAAIYAALEAEVPQSPEGLLFTDDRGDNIAAAAARGWQTHQFHAPEGFAKRLVAEGLLSPEEAQ